MPTPKVSICAPAYNNASEVERLLKSIYEQSFTDFEVNISDDSTDDEIEQLVLFYVEAHENINYIHNEKPYGHIFNWNAAVKMARGEYIKIMFSDDWFTDSESLAAYVRLLDNAPEAMLAFAGSRQVSLDDGMKYYDRHASQEFINRLRKDYRLFFLGNEIGTPSASIYRRGGMPALFDEKSNWASDMYLYFDLLIKSPAFAYTEKPLVSVGVHKNQYTESFSDKDMRIYADYRYMYEKYRLWEKRECKEYFLKKFIIKYRRGLREAKMLKIGAASFIKYSFLEFMDSVRCFVNYRFLKKA